MSKTHYFYLPISVVTLEEIVSDHQTKFDDLLADLFSEDELVQFEQKIDAIAAVYVQPILTELTFDDFYPDPQNEDEQRIFFERCQSSLCLENLPYLENNPFQVTYLTELLKRFEEVLVDQGGVSELSFKENYLRMIQRFKDIESLLPPLEKKVEVKTFLPVDPIDFLIIDVYKEIDRLKVLNQLPSWNQCPIEKSKKLFSMMSSSRLDPATLYVRSGLNAKDFDDYLEKLKFWLKKI